MKEYIIQISDEEEKALLTELEDVKGHLEIVIHDLARKAMGNIILVRTNMNPQKLSHMEREELIKPMELETMADRIVREARELEE